MGHRAVLHFPLEDPQPQTLDLRPKPRSIKPRKSCRAGFKSKLLNTAARRAFARDRPAVCFCSCILCWLQARALFLSCSTAAHACTTLQTTSWDRRFMMPLHAALEPGPEAELFACQTSDFIPAATKDGRRGRKGVESTPQTDPQRTVLPQTARTMPCLGSDLATSMLTRGRA